MIRNFTHVSVEPRFRDSKFAMLFNESTNIDANLSILKEKHKIFKNIMKTSETQKALSVKLLAKQMMDKKKQEKEMRNTRIFQKPFLEHKSKHIPELLLESSVPKLADIEIKCCWNKLKTSGWIPESREGATLIGCGQSLYLIGGLSRDILNQVLVTSIMNPKWFKLEIFSQKLEPIFAHSCLIYENQLLVLGGVSSYNEVTRKREFLGMIKSLNPETLSVDYIVTHGLYEFRKYHSTVLYGQHILLYGGLNPKNSILDLCTILNLQTNTWRNLETIGHRPKELAGHAACSVYNTNEISSLFSKPKGLSTLLHQGVYLFGGYNESYKPNNKVYVLVPGKRPLAWITPDTTGKAPSPRYYHTMIRLEKLNILVIYGGRNDETGISYGDVHILKLDNFAWASVSVTGEIPSPRSSHSATCLNNNLYIFGGVSYGKFCSSETHILQFDLNNKHHY